MKSIARAAVLSLGILGTGCAAPITYYSPTPDAVKTGMVHFVSQGGTYSTIALYQDVRTCQGIQRVAFFKPGVDQTVYVPHGAYLTFSAYVQFPGYPRYVYGSSMYSVPFRSGDLRVIISYDSKSMYTRIERREAGGDWIVVRDAVPRQSHQPFFESGDWCKASPAIPQ